MAIKKIKVTNFKSFKDLDVDLGNFNILIGANASGKSNFVQIFKFLKDIAVSGLENAVSLQGGIEYTQNLILGKGNNTLFNVNSDRTFLHGQSHVGINITKEIIPEFDIIEHKFALRHSDVKVKIVEDVISYRSHDNFVKLSKTKNNTLSIETGNLDPQYERIIDSLISLFNNDKNYLLSDSYFLYSSPLTSLFTPYKNIFENISFYDFDPKLPKKATPIAGKAELEEDGSNLSIVLNTIIENKDKKDKLLGIMKDILPFVNDLKVEKFADRSMLFTIKERFFDKLLPASLISDGTINVTALILALYFDEKPLAIIEEPERNIHPHLMSRLVEMMKDASRNKQIIITTHNPELIKHADLDDILFVSRDSEGFTQITRPSEKEEIKVFLKNEIGLDELFVQNMLEF